MKNKTITLLIFGLLLGGAITLIATLLPKWANLILLLIFLIAIWFFYDRYIVKLLGWKYAWWSPHKKRIFLDIDKKDFFPEMVILSYFLEKEYPFYQRHKTENGFLIGGKKESIRVIGEQDKDHFKVTFYPTISKKTILIMKEFEDHIKKIKIDS